MPYQDDFEKRRRERRRRARRRKKRIRAAILLVALVGVIALGVLAISTITKNHSESDNIVSNTDGDTITESMPPEPTQQPARTALNIPSASEEADLIEIIADSNQVKRCYLTFDDGPTDNITPQILDVLRRYNIKATFFEVGSMIEANPDMARRVYEEGHLIANHSAGHNYDKVYASTEDFINEINNCFDTIRGVMDGEDPFPLFRFPGGSYNAGDHAEMKQECKKVLAQNGYYYCDWNCLNGDAEGRTKDAQGLYEYFVNTSEGYNNLIVLMHDAATKQATADALPSIIDYLINQGYTFHRLDDIEYNPTGVNSASDVSGSSDSSDSSGEDYSGENVSPGSVSSGGSSSNVSSSDNSSSDSGSTDEDSDSSDSGSSSKSSSSKKSSDNDSSSKSSSSKKSSDNDSSDEDSSDEDSSDSDSSGSDSSSKSSSSKKSSDSDSSDSDSSDSSSDSSSSGGSSNGGSSGRNANSSLGTTTRTSVNGNTTVTTNSSNEN